MLSLINIIKGMHGKYFYRREKIKQLIIRVHAPLRVFSRNEDLQKVQRTNSKDNQEELDVALFVC
jgi:hypothetical protein